MTGDTTAAPLTHVRRAVVVIGAGQAGLAAAHHLRRHGFTPGVDLEVLDANEGPGGAWRHRWDALTFDDAHGIHDLPGMPLGEVDAREPAREVVKRYYAAYERAEGLPVRRPVRVTSVERREGGGFLVHAATTPDARGADALGSAHERGSVARGGGKVGAPGSGEPGRDGLLVDLGVGTGDGVARDAGGRVRAHPEIVFSTDSVISATGTWDSPFVPIYPGRFDGRQLTTRDFVSPDEFTGQRVLVVGGGASAVQFALLLDEHGADTVWTTRRPPQWTADPLDPSWGRDVERRVREKTHRGLPSGSVVSNTGLALIPRYRDGIERGVLVSRGAIARFTAGGVDFVDGSHEQVDAVLWATGFRASLGHLAPLRLREPGGGLLVGDDDVSVVREPGLFVVGYGASASTIGATRAGRSAARAASRVTAPVPAERPELVAA